MSKALHDGVKGKPLVHRTGFSHETIGIMQSENTSTLKTFKISPSGTFTANLKSPKSQRLSGVAQAIEIRLQAALYLLCRKSNEK